jgi:hypothetical protein
VEALSLLTSGVLTETDELLTTAESASGPVVLTPNDAPAGAATARITSMAGGNARLNI